MEIRVVTVFERSRHFAPGNSAIVMKVLIVMVRAMEYYSQVCSSYLDQNESQGGEVLPSHSNFVVRY